MKVTYKSTYSTKHWDYAEHFRGGWFRIPGTTGGDGLVQLAISFLAVKEERSRLTQLGRFLILWVRYGKSKARAVIKSTMFSLSRLRKGVM